MAHKEKLKKKSKRYLLILSLAGVLSIGILSYLNLYSEGKLKEIVGTPKLKQTIYPKQFSDENITSNAVISDPEFRNLFVFDKNVILANTISAVTPNPNGVIDNEPEKGTWLWTPILDQTETYRKSVILGAKKNGVRNIYISLDSYLDIFVLPDGPEKKKMKDDFDSTLEAFITLAHQNGISVDAEGGWRNWAEIGHSYKAFTILDYAIRFNKTHTEKLRGFQYDVEPYLLEAYQDNKAKVLGNFINLIDETVARLNGSDLLFSVVIPDFYDGATGETPKFFYAGSQTYTFDHLLKILERRTGSSIIVMSYRNFSKGDDGSIEISRDEIQRANTYKTKIIVAQETGDVNPPYVTFFKTTKPYYRKQLLAIEKEFAIEKSFGGVAVHYINALIDLK